MNENVHVAPETSDELYVEFTYKSGPSSAVWFHALAGSKRRKGEESSVRRV